MTYVLDSVPGNIYRGLINYILPGPGSGTKTNGSGIYIMFNILRKKIADKEESAEPRNYPNKIFPRVNFKEKKQTNAVVSIKVFNP
jgi:hypothetical protein